MHNNFLCMHLYQFSIAAMLYYLKFGSLTQTCILQFLGGHVQHSLCQSKVKAFQGCVPVWYFQGRLYRQTHLSCWLNEPPCGCRLEVPVSLLAFSQVSSSASSSTFLDMFVPLSHLLSRQQWDVFLMQRISLLLSSLAKYL